MRVQVWTWIVMSKIRSRTNARVLTRIGFEALRFLAMMGPMSCGSD